MSSRTDIITSLKDVIQALLARPDDALLAATAEVARQAITETAALRRRVEIVVDQRDEARRLAEQHQSRRIEEGWIAERPLPWQGP